MCNQISDILIFNGEVHAISRIALIRKRRPKGEKRYDFTPRTSRATNDGDGYSSVWEIIDNCLMLKQINAQEVVEFEPPRMVEWYSGTIVLSTGKRGHTDRFGNHHMAESLELRIQQGKVAAQVIVDHSQKIAELRAEHEEIFGGPLEEGRVHLI